MGYFAGAPSWFPHSFFPSVGSYLALQYKMLCHIRRSCTLAHIFQFLVRSSLCCPLCPATTSIGSSLKLSRVRGCCSRQRGSFAVVQAKQPVVRQAMSVERQRGKLRRPKRKADSHRSFMTQALNISPCRHGILDAVHPFDKEKKQPGSFQDLYGIYRVQ